MPTHNQTTLSVNPNTGENCGREHVLVIKLPQRSHTRFSLLSGCLSNSHRFVPPHCGVVWGKRIDCPIGECKPTLLTCSIPVFCTLLSAFLCPYIISHILIFPSGFIFAGLPPCLLSPPPLSLFPFLSQSLNLWQVFSFEMVMLFLIQEHDRLII